MTAMTYRPGTLGLHDARASHEAERARAFEKLRWRWLDAIAVRADPTTIRQLAELVHEAGRA